MSICVETGRGCKSLSDGLPDGFERILLATKEVLAFADLHIVKGKAPWNKPGLGFSTEFSQLVVVFGHKTGHSGRRTGTEFSLPKNGRIALVQDAIDILCRKEGKNSLAEGETSYIFVSQRDSLGPQHSGSYFVKIRPITRLDSADSHWRLVMALEKECQSSM